LTPFVAKAAQKTGTDLENYIFARVLVTVLNEAAIAFDDGVASKADIDTAMRLGTNYPRGPLEWAEQVGADLCKRMLRALNGTVADDRFKPARLFGGGSVPTVHRVGAPRPGCPVSPAPP